MYTALACITSCCSGLDRPLPRWRRRLVEICSQTCTRVVLFAVGYWWPRVIGLHNYRQGQEMGAVSQTEACVCTAMTHAVIRWPCLQCTAVPAAMQCAVGCDACRWLQPGFAAGLSCSCMVPASSLSQHCTQQTRAACSALQLPSFASTMQVGVFNHVSYLGELVCWTSLSRALLAEVHA